MPVSPLILRAPDILRGAGCKVVEYPGWRERGRPWTFTPRAAVLHHDGSPSGPAHDPEAYARFLFETGRPSEGIPAPLCQFWIDYYGAIWIGAAGGANHAGLGAGWGVLPANQGNQYSVGFEMDNTTGEPTTDAQYEALHKGLPALFKAYGWDPANALCGHKEYAPGRKFDPDDIDMPAMRAYVGGDHQDGEDWLDMATLDEVKDAVRGVLNEGTGEGQKSWAGTSKATLGTAQGLVNQVAALGAGGTTIIKLADNDAQWLASPYDGTRTWIESQQALADFGLKERGFEEVPDTDERWKLINITGRVPDGWPPEIG
jgi:hypothetical protein